MSSSPQAGIISVSGFGKIRGQTRGSLSLTEEETITRNIREWLDQRYTNMLRLENPLLTGVFLFYQTPLWTNTDYHEKFTTEVRGSPLLDPSTGLLMALFLGNRRLLSGRGNVDEKKVKDGEETTIQLSQQLEVPLFDVALSVFVARCIKLPFHSIEWNLKYVCQPLINRKRKEGGGSGGSMNMTEEGSSDGDLSIGDNLHFHFCASVEPDNFTRVFEQVGGSWLHKSDLDTASFALRGQIVHPGHLNPQAKGQGDRIGFLAALGHLPHISELSPFTNHSASFQAKEESSLLSEDKSHGLTRDSSRHVMWETHPERQNPTSRFMSEALTLMGPRLQNSEDESAAISAEEKMAQILKEVGTVSLGREIQECLVGAIRGSQRDIFTSFLDAFFNLLSVDYLTKVAAGGQVTTTAAAARRGNSPLASLLRMVVFRANKLFPESPSSSSTSPTTGGADDEKKREGGDEKEGRKTSGSVLSTLIPRILLNPENDFLDNFSEFLNTKNLSGEDRCRAEMLNLELQEIVAWSEILRIESRRGRIAEQIPDPNEKIFQVLAACGLQKDTFFLDAILQRVPSWVFDRDDSPDDDDEELIEGHSFAKKQVRSAFRKQMYRVGNLAAEANNVEVLRYLLSPNLSSRDGSSQKESVASSVKTTLKSDSRGGGSDVREHFSRNWETTPLLFKSMLRGALDNFAVESGLFLLQEILPNFLAYVTKVLLSNPAAFTSEQKDSVESELLTVAGLLAGRPPTPLHGGEIAEVFKTVEKKAKEKIAVMLSLENCGSRVH